MKTMTSIFIFLLSVRFFSVSETGEANRMTKNAFLVILTVNPSKPSVILWEIG